MSFKDYYRILDVNRDTNPEDIRNAFRRLALRYHPDRNPNNPKQTEEKFKEINEAYEVLGNEQKRRQYDHLTSLSGYPRSRIMMEDVFSESVEAEVLREMLQKLADLGFVVSDMVAGGRGTASAGRYGNVVGNGGVNRVKRRAVCDQFNCLWPRPLQAFGAQLGDKQCPA